jgi:endonuclease-8
VIANTKWVAIGYKLGMADMLRTRDVKRLTGALGPDVMAEGFDPLVAAERVIAQGERTIGATLLDQHVVAGIGTIYMAESLFKWRVHPGRAAGAVPDVPGLLAYASKILRRSVEARSPTSSGDTRRGWTTKVHGREHLPCRICSTEIEVMRVGQPPFDRPAFYCPTCQKT